MTDPAAAPRRSDRRLAAALALGALAVLALAAAVLTLGLQARAPRAASAPVESRDAGATFGEASAWRPVAPGSALASAVDVAFAAGAALATDGKLATYNPGDGAPRPLEVPAPIPRVFSAAGRLFAAGENEGAPFLIMLSPNEEALVVPVPCAVSRLAGEGSVVVGSCAAPLGLAVSADGGRSFHPLPLELPAPREPVDSDLERSIDAVAASPGGGVAVAVAQRWLSSQPGGALSWTLGQVGLRADKAKPFRFFNVHALVRTVGMRLAGSSVTLAGLEVALDGPGEGETHARLWRGSEAEPPVAVGVPGPSCGRVDKARSVEGVLLDEKVALLRCGEGLAVTLDGGASWTLDRSLGAVQLLCGSDMRLFARAAEKGFERRFVGRSETGATAVRVPGLMIPKRDAGEPFPLASPSDVKEPSLDAGTDAGADAGP